MPLLSGIIAGVLGGILVADEVIDLFLPLLFYRVRRWRLGRHHRGSEECRVLPSVLVERRQPAER